MARISILAVLTVLGVCAAACGGSERDPRTGQPAAAESAVAVAALGDSITAGNPLYDPDPGQRQALGFGSEPESQYPYWASRAEPDLDFDNCGVFGERTDEISQRLAACADGADVVVVQGGINDIAQALSSGRQATAAAVSSAAANLDGMLAEADELGLDAAVADVLPWNNGHPAADRPIARLNRAIEKIAERRDVPLLEFHRALESEDEPGTMSPAYTDDGDHPSIEGYRVLGELVAEKLG